MSLYVDIEKRLKGFHLRAKFECEREVLGVLGASGSGKSMTLKCIAGIEKPDWGRIILDGQVLYDSDRRINLPPQKRHVGYLFQNYALFPNMTVMQNILCGLHNEHDKSLRAQILSRTLDLLQLSELVNHMPSQLSGGEAQRTALARILVNRPKILMLDEPFSALDTHLRFKLQLQLRDLLKNYGQGVLLVTHDRNEAYCMCDSIAVLHDGHLLGVKGTKEFFAQPGSVSAALLSGCKNIVKAFKVGEHEVRVPEWNLSLTTKAKVEDGLIAIGIRAHNFDVDTLENSHEVIFEREIEDVFENVIEFRFKTQDAESEALFWYIRKDEEVKEFPERLGVDSSKVMLLYDE